MTATSEQIAAIGAAARNLLQSAWQRDPRIDHYVVSGLTAVGKTFATDPAASAALFRHAIEADHLKEHGYSELRWIAREIVNVTRSDPSLVVEIYRAAYGYAERSSDATAMGSSVLLALQSNRRQDYESTWYGLANALPQILDINTEAGVLALAHGLDGYIQREHNYSAELDGRLGAPIAFGTSNTALRPDYSHAWYRGGNRALQDGPKLLKTFEEHLEPISGRDGAGAAITAIIDALTSLPVVPAAVWASLLIVGARYPGVYARRLHPLAIAAPVMLCLDTRFQLGGFIRAAYGEFSAQERAAIEAALLALPSESHGDRSKAILAGCIPNHLVATADMTAYLARLQEAGQEESNREPFKFEITAREYGTDAYLADQGVSLDDPASVRLRDLMRKLEDVTANDKGEAPTIQSIDSRLGAMEQLQKGLAPRLRQGVPDKLYEHATAELAAAAESVSRVDLALLDSPNVRLRLKRILLFCAKSAHPHYSVKHERQFHEHLHWGAPSARTSAATGLMDLTRGQTRRDGKMMAAIRMLARDRVPEVRLQIVGHLGMLQALDLKWAWSEAEHALRKDVTRGVVTGALQSVTRLAHADLARAIRLSKIVLQRYRNKTGSGMQLCRSMAASLIFDLHIHERIPEADSFAADVMRNATLHAELIQNLVARYSENLLAGDIGNQDDPNHAARKRTLAFYQAATAAASSQIERLFDRDGGSASLSETDQQTVRSMAGILDEVSMRLNFAVGASGNDSRSQNRADEQGRLFWEAQDILSGLSRSMVAQVAHHLIETLEVFIPLDPARVFALISVSVRSAERGGYSFERMAADLIVRIVERYLADYRAVFVERDRLNDLIDCLDIFVRAGWPAAQSWTFKLGEIWR
jgi:hypothetical protein